MFEILFLLFVLLSVVALVVAIVQLVSGKNRAAGRTASALMIAWIGYLGTVAAVSALTPQRFIDFGHDLCSDEMCFTATDIRMASELGPPAHRVKANGVFYLVTVRVSNHARGRTEAELGVDARLWDGVAFHGTNAKGMQAYAQGAGKSTPLTVRLAAGTSAFSVQVFDLPASVTPQGLVLHRGFTPGFFVIGESPLFHGPTIVRLPSLPRFHSS